MKKSLYLCAAAGLLALASCNKTEKTETENHNATVTENTDANTTADPEAMYRERASQTASQMAKDLKFDSDTAMQRKVSTVYYTRAKRRNEARGKYATDTTGMHKEMRQIDLETDQEFRTMLKPEQFKTYETNRTTYYGGFEETATSSPSMDTSMANSGTSSSSSSTSGNGTMSSNAKVRTKTEKDGDTKTEIEDGNSETKIKTDKNGQTKTKVHEKH